jgi:4-amino-4-deoxy-L-arabinose transferase-like glycosyltransferase
VDNARPQAVSSSNDRRLFALATALAAIMFVFPLAIHFPLLDPDEGLHASIAQEMVERGDWLTPRFLGEPFFDKPILYFWCQALSLRLFGMNEAAVRLPGLMFGLLGAITTGAIGWRMLGRTAGWMSGIFYGTMILPVALAQAASHDVALIPCINLSVLFLWESQHAEAKPDAAACALAAGFMLGLTVLIKGLIGAALVGTAFGTYLLITRRWSIKNCLSLLEAFFVAAIVALPWFVAVEMKNPGFLRYYFIERHFLGFATATQLHGEAPWWYYLPIILGGGLPWIGYLPVSIGEALDRQTRNNHTKTKINNQYRNSPHPYPLPKGEGTFVDFPKGEGTFVDFPKGEGTFVDFPKGEGTFVDLPKGEGTHNSSITLLICWLIGCTVLLSVARSKLVTYIWPVFPAVAVLASFGWARLLDNTLAENRRRSLLRTFLFSSIGGPIVLPLAIFVVHKLFAVDFPPPVWIAACLAGMTALIPLVFLKKRQWRAMLAASTLSTAAQFIAVFTWIVPRASENFTAQGLARYFNQSGRVPVRLLVAEERLGSLVFYLDPELRLRLKEKQIGMIFHDQPTEIPPGTVVVLPERRGDQAFRYKELAGLTYKTIGRYRLYKIAGRDQHTEEGN